METTIERNPEPSRIGTQEFSFLFWNVCQKPLGPLISEIVDEFRVDIIILAEDETPRHKMLAELNVGRAKSFASASLIEHNKLSC